MNQPKCHAVSIKTTNLNGDDRLCRYFIPSFSPVEAVFIVLSNFDFINNFEIEVVEEIEIDSIEEDSLIEGSCFFYVPTYLKELFS